LAQVFRIFLFLSHYCTMVIAHLSLGYASLLVIATHAYSVEELNLLSLQNRQSRKLEDSIEQGSTCNFCEQYCGATKAGHGCCVSEDGTSKFMESKKPERERCQQTGVWCSGGNKVWAGSELTKTVGWNSDTEECAVTTTTTTTTMHNCATKEVWSNDKMEWCCANEGTGCPPLTDCVCTAIYAPVCANGTQDYSNSCEASCAGLQDVTDGMCKPMHDCTTKEVWSTDKMEWCCAHEGAGCPTPVVSVYTDAPVTTTGPQAEWAKHATGEKCTGQSFDISAAASQYACEQQAILAKHSFYQYHARQGFCATVAACFTPTPSAGYMVYRNPALFPLIAQGQRCSNKKKNKRDGVESQLGCQHQAMAAGKNYYTWNAQKNVCIVSKKCKNSPAGASWGSYKSFFAW